MSNNLAAFDATQFADKVVEKLNRTNIMLPLVSREYEGDLTQNSTVKIRTLGNITMGPYTGSITYQDLAPSSEEFTVADKQYFAFAVEDWEVAQNDLSALDLYAERAAVTMNDVIEDKLMAQYAKAHADNRITGAANAAIALTKDNIYDYCVDARVRLGKKNVPNVGRYLILDPDTYALVLKSPEFKRATPTGDDTIANASVGNIAGFSVYESNAVQVAGGAKFLLYGQMGAINYAGQIAKSERIRLQDRFGDAVRGLLLHDATVVNESQKRIGYIKGVA